MPDSDCVNYHPDHTETGDLSRFLLLNQAYVTLTGPERRSPGASAESATQLVEVRTGPLGLVGGGAI